MAKNEFLPFGIADGANVLTNEEYGKLAARTNGFSSGVAKSQELNKVWRQASVIASVVAQFISETNDQDVLDDGNTTALRNGLLSALRATARTSLPNASTTTPGIVKLSSGINSDSELTAATSLAVKIAHEAGYWANKNADNRLEKRRNGGDIPNKSEFVKNLGLTDTVYRTVGNGRNQIPDMSFFESQLTESGYQKLPSGVIIQWGRAYGTTSVSGASYGDWYQTQTMFEFPVHFPNKCVSLTNSVLSGGTSERWIVIASTIIVDRKLAELLIQSLYKPSKPPVVTYIAIGY
ncbi:putative tail fiber protein [Xenorhabdus poinarii G6]|uniref:Putative tail fiber protein n=1 Tax=Xenorhabdus poinarii G6 TaxID=1354304 RepID=A0A068R1E0_9GAMM|nr:phage tail protein [Xenorhabdus poinarii]CDG20706.1 putative tail fiber protein [Xenorhabdus poinarii G6]